MAGVIYLIVFASFSLIVAKGQDRVSEQLREIKETLTQRDALYQQQQHHISGIAENLQTLTGTMERYLAMLEDGQTETRRRIDARDQEQKNIMYRQAENIQNLTGTMQRYLAMLEDGHRGKGSCSNTTTSHDVITQLEVADLPRDCAAIQRSGQTHSGVYTVQHNNKPLAVYCDLETDGGGWLVFQRRQDGSVDFYRNWTQYEFGFGDNTEFWLGNIYLNSLTSADTYQLRVDMEDYEGEKGYAVYDSFSVGSTEDKYELTIGAYQGTAGDSLTGHNGCKFSTYDNDNDASSSTNCARNNHAAGWYKECYYSNPNGRYGESNAHGAIVWNTFRGFYYSLKYFQMKFRPSDF